MIRPLVATTGRLVEGQVQEWSATCRDCGDLPPVATPQTHSQAVLVQNRHLAEHLAALAAEMKEAAR